MQQCPDCGRVYDESEYARCPYCSGDFSKTLKTYSASIQTPMYDKQLNKKRYASEDGNDINSTKYELF